MDATLNQLVLTIYNSLLTHFNRRILLEFRPQLLQIFYKIWHTADLSQHFPQWKQDFNPRRMWNVVPEAPSSASSASLARARTSRAAVQRWMTGSFFPSALPWQRHRRSPILLGTTFTKAHGGAHYLSPYVVPLLRNQMSDMRLNRSVAVLWKSNVKYLNRKRDYWLISFIS